MDSKIRFLAGAVAKASALSLVTTQTFESAPQGTKPDVAVTKNIHGDLSGTFCFDEQRILVQGSTSYLISKPSLTEKWTKKEQKRFDKLLLKKIEKNISLDERTELDKLTLLRRKREPSRTADEIMRAARRQKLILEMNELLRKYVKFSENNEHNKANWYPKAPQSADEGATLPA